MRDLFKRTTALPSFVFAAATIASASFAEEVTLKSTDGTVDLVGEFVEFVDNTYVIRTELGELRISAARVRCEGEACPVIETASADVQFAGSDTVGNGVMPLLLEGYAGFLDAEASIATTAREGEFVAELVGDGGFGDPLGSYLVTASGSNDAFRALQEGNAEVGMSSRRIVPVEARALRDAGAGNMIKPTQEHIIAVDSLVVITHPTNPINSLRMTDLAGIYSGQITNWSQLDGEDIPIKVFGREITSGTGAVFAERVFGEGNANFSSEMAVLEDNSSVAAAVNDDPGAIGFVGYAFQRGAKPLTLVNECGLSMTPDAFSARTEEYALQRRLYLYNREDISEKAREFLDYAKSPEADQVILKAGFVGLGIERRPQPLDGDRARALLDPNVDAYEGGVMREMLGRMVDYERMSTTFRFNTGSSRLDERGTADMGRLIDYVEALPDGTEVLFVGFTDNVGAFDSNRVLSENRARQVATDLEALAGSRLTGVQLSSLGFGEIAPSACNITDEGRRINRRVEVWIKVPT